MALKLPPLTATHINLSHCNLYTMPDLSQYVLATHLFLYQNNLTDIPKQHLPPNLVALYCQGNQLTQANDLPSTIEILYCSNNEITALEHLPPSLRILVCFNNKLATLERLPPNLEELYCQNNIELAMIQNIPPTLKTLRYTSSVMMDKDIVVLEGCEVFVDGKLV